MDENNFQGGGSGNSGTGGTGTGTGTSGTTGTGTSGTGSTGSMGGGSGSSGSMGSSSEAFGANTGGSMGEVGTSGSAGGSITDDQGLSAGIVSVLEKFGVGENQINAVRDTLKNVNIDQQLDKAKEQVTDSLNKARDYAKQNPGAVLAGVAVLVIGAGLLASSMKKDRD